MELKFNYVQRHKSVQGFPQVSQYIRGMTSKLRVILGDPLPMKCLNF